MKYLLIIVFSGVCVLFSAQQRVSGIVVDSNTGKALALVNVNLDNEKSKVSTDKDGKFEIQINESSHKLIFSKPGYENTSITVSLPSSKPLLIQLHGKLTEIEEVKIATGYQIIPKERATGAFEIVDRKLLEKQVAVNILDKLSIAANSLMINNSTTQNKRQIMIRGLSTIRGPKSPLIILDDFPYEGDLDNINPNTVESITILKDAAASSIWGARAANGVIVISTKRGEFNKPIRIDFNSSITLSDKPDLSRINSMTSSDYIDMETELFKRGFYNSKINSTKHPALSPVVSLLNKVKKGMVTQQEADLQLDKWRRTDVRDQYLKYMYRPSENRQYALNMSGGFPNFSWTSSIGYDDNSGNLDERFDRLNLKIQSSWKPIDRLRFSFGVNFNKISTESGRTGYGGVLTTGNGWPYMSFAEDNGSPIAFPYQYDTDYLNSLGGGQLFDWNYYPLTEWSHIKSTSEKIETILNAGVKLNIIPGLDADIKYQHHRVNGISQQLSDVDSYSVRSTINSYTVLNTDGTLTYNIPMGGIFDFSNSVSKIDNLRGQLSYNRRWKLHEVSALLGGEIRTATSESNSNRHYGYQSENLFFSNINYNLPYPLLTGGMGNVYNSAALSHFNTNYISAFANASYTFKNKYTVSGSARRDASNLFGLATNDLWNPFWSTGAAWHISKEDFFNISWFPYLKIRSSIGFNGNIDPSMVAVPTIKFSKSFSMFTNTQMAQIDNYYNPLLRWESMRIINVAADFELFNRRVMGYIEFFNKKGENLFGNSPLDPTTGISSLTLNAAGMKGSGLDLQLKTLNIDRNFKWNTLLNFSTFQDEVTSYNLTNTMARQFLLSTVPISGIVGLPVYSMFAYKWAGLDPETGDPMGYLDGEISKNYNLINGSGTDVADLEYFGSAIPTMYGNLTNSFSFKQFSLDVGLSYKLDYWFRRPSIHYTNLFSSAIDHSDYAKRWQNPGDEKFTNVPSNLYKTNSNRDAFFAGSSVLVEKGDHIRLQFINLSYQINPRFFRNAFFKGMQLYGNASNLGILWQASKSGVDPDYNLGQHVRQRASYTLGLKANF